MNTPQAQPPAAPRNIQIRLAMVADIALIRALAESIWRACYPGIISPEQIEYMLQRMYSPETVRAELENGVVWELMVLDGQAAGYLSYEFEAEPRRIKLHKLYLLPAMHGRGFARQAMAHVLEKATHAGAGQVYLQVNKQNARAIAAYRKIGFRIADALRCDIGGGFVMDDYVMACDVAAPGDP